MRIQLPLLRLSVHQLLERHKPRQILVSLLIAAALSETGHAEFTDAAQARIARVHVVLLLVLCLDSGRVPVFVRGLNGSGVYGQVWNTDVLFLG